MNTRCGPRPLVQEAVLTVLVCIGCGNPTEQQPAFKATQITYSEDDGVRSADSTPTEDSATSGTTKLDAAQVPDGSSLGTQDSTLQADMSGQDQKEAGINKADTTAPDCGDTGVSKPFVCVDGTQVKSAKHTTGCVLVYEALIDCKNAGFENCGPGPKGGPKPSKPIDLCVNACGGYGKKLKAPKGSKVKKPGLSCAKYVCNDQGEVEPDHTDCKQLGNPCSSHKQCISLNCKPDGQCGG